MATISLRCGRAGVPSLLAVVAAVALPLACVPRARLVAAESALGQERTAHEQTTRALAAANVAREAADRAAEAAARELQARAAEVQDLDRHLSGIELDATVAAQQRSEQALLVDQLRAELARSAAHLDAFGQERTAREAALAEATARLGALDKAAAEEPERALLLRDLTLAAYEPLATGEAELLIVDGEPTLRLPVTQLYREPGGTLRPEIEPLLRAAVRVAGVHGVRVLTVTAVGGPFEGAPADLAARLELVAAALVRGGAKAEQVVVAVPLGEGGAELAQVLGEAGAPPTVALAFSL